jgi:UPF0716 family protein affecting phage T7 exclusion
MFFNGFTLLLIIISAVAGFAFGIRVQEAHEFRRRDEWLNGATIEDQMKQDGWVL